MPEIIEAKSYPAQPLTLVIEPEVNAGRRAFPVTQQLFAGTPIGVAQVVESGWYDTSTDPESGAFALVQLGAGLDDLIGEIVQATHGEYSVFAYVLKAAPIPTPFALARRAWFAIARPALETLQLSVVPVE